MNNFDDATKILNERFGKDTFLSLATTESGRPFVRIVNSYYENGSFYVITYALSNKMRQIGINSEVAVCGEWFTSSGVGKNMGHVLDEKNSDIMEKLRKVFGTWYNNGHMNESDSNTCLLCIRLTHSVLFNNGIRYEIDFEKETA